MRCSLLIGLVALTMNDDDGSLGEITTDDVLLALHGAESEEELCTVILGVLIDDYRAKAGVVLVRQGERLVPFRWFGLEDEDVTMSIRLDSPEAERLRTGVPLHVADIRGDFIRRLGGRRAVPCCGRDDLHAVVVVSAVDEDPLWGFLTGVSKHIGLAIEKLEFAPASRTAGRSAVGGVDERIFNMTQSFGYADTLHGTARRLVRAAVEAIGASSGVLYLHEIEVDELVLVAASGLLDKGLEHRVCQGADDAQRLAPGQGIAGDMLLQGQLVYVPDSGAADAPTVKWPETVKPGAYLFVPLRLHRELVGVLGLRCERARARLEHAGPVLAPLCDRAAIALHRARVLEPLCQDTETELFDGRLVEALLDGAIWRADSTDQRTTVVSMRFGESSTHRSSEPLEPPPIQEAADALLRASRQDLDLVGHLGHGRFVAVLEDTGTEVALSHVRAIFDELHGLRTDVSIHAAAIVERRVGESGESVWDRTHELLTRLYDEGPGGRVAVVTLVRERIVREGVPDFVTPLDPEWR